MGIQFDKVTYTYRTGSLTNHIGLDSVDLELEEGGFIAVLGEPGSGKSTLLQHFNGILRPTEGSIRILDFEIRAGESLKNTGKLRKRVGLVFQFPEQQLFEETIEKDLIFGPKNFGATDEEAKTAARRVLEIMGLDSSILTQNPFRLSGGQMRKAAIAAVLAADPDVFVLDEPTASLDPASREELMKLLRRLCDDHRKTIVVVTHRLEEVLPYADELVVMRRGGAVFHGSAADLMKQEELLEQAGLIVPAPIRLMRRVAEQLHIDFSGKAYGIQAIADAVCEAIGSKQSAPDPVDMEVEPV